MSAPTEAELASVKKYTIGSAALQEMSSSQAIAGTLVLGRLAGADDVVVGTPIAGRTRRETEGLVGLFLLRSWGRSVSLYSTGAGLLLYLFSGPELLSPLESVLFEVSTLLWGAVLALSYYSPIAVRLDANQSSEPDSPGGSA